MSLNKQVKYNKDGSMKTRGIEWTDATWNPVTGCPHQCRWVMPDGTVAECYAETIAGKYSKSYPDGFDAHYWYRSALDAPLKHDKPLKIFVGSMSDVFSKQVPEHQIHEMLDVMRRTPQHTYQMLTKNPIRSLQFDLPNNVWLGASMPPDQMHGKTLTHQKKVNMLHKMLGQLSDVRVPIRWMSFEPLSWDVAPIISEYPNVIQWAVIGAASKGRRKYAPNVTHFNGLLDVLTFDEVPVFFKGNLSSLGRVASPWREEFPRLSMIEMYKEGLGDDTNYS